jgi:cytochrome d ubiquinol oxidase subunit I
MLLKRYVDDPATATVQRSRKPPWTLFRMWPWAFFSFRLMAGIGFLFIAVFAVAFYFVSLKRKVPRWFLYLAFYSIPLPWIARSLAGSLLKPVASPG